MSKLHSTLRILLAVGLVGLTGCGNDSEEITEILSPGDGVLLPAM